VVAIVVNFSVSEETVVCSAVKMSFPSSSATAELVVFGKLLCNLALD
jgi:hypothetical protein